MSDTENINIPPSAEWVLVKEKLHHISEFAHLPSHTRPRVTCPACEEEVIMKLGKVKRHHVAHPPESNCPTRNPESAIHFNTKMHLFYQLRQATKLDIEQMCTDCSRSQSITWIDGWDGVEVEYKFGQRRPDIALLRNGMVVAAIEVYVTHAVDFKKIAYYQAEGIQWIEVTGSVGIYEGRGAWNSQVSLKYDSGDIGTSEWTCDNCTARIRRGILTEKQEQERREMEKQWDENRKQLKVQKKKRMTGTKEIMELSYML